MNNSEPPIQPGQVSSTHELVKQEQKAMENKKILDILLGTTAQNTGARPITNLKNPETAIKKVGIKNEEDPTRNYTLEDVNDYARGRLVYPDMKSLRTGVKDFENNIKQLGLKVGKVTDYFGSPKDGYMGYHVDIKLPNGQTSEVQFHTDQSYANALATHQDHAQFGDQKPGETASRDRQTSKGIMELPQQLAQMISGNIEQKNAPMLQEGEAKAQQVAQMGGVNG